MKSIQRYFNNNSFNTNKSSNEICYDFISFQSLNLIKDESSRNIDSVI